MRTQARWELGEKGGGTIVAVRVAAPTEMARPVEHFLDAHFLDDVGMRAHPRPSGRNLAQQRIKGRARLALVDRIDPDQHRIENAYEAAVFWGRLPACGGIASREDSDCVTGRGMSSGVHAQAPRKIAC